MPCKRRETKKKYFRFFNGVEYYHVASFIYQRQADRYAEVVREKGGMARVVTGQVLAGTHAMNGYLVFVRDDEKGG